MLTFIYSLYEYYLNIGVIKSLPIVTTFFITILHTFWIKWWCWY